MLGAFRNGAWPGRLQDIQRKSSAQQNVQPFCRGKPRLAHTHSRFNGVGVLVGGVLWNEQKTYKSEFLWKKPDPNGKKQEEQKTPTAYRLPPTAHRPPPTAYRLPPTAYRLPPTAYRLPPTAYRLPPTAYRLPPTAYRPPPTAYRPPPTAYRHSQK